MGRSTLLAAGLRVLATPRVARVGSLTIDRLEARVVGAASGGAPRIMIERV